MTKEDIQLQVLKSVVTLIPEDINFSLRESDDGIWLRVYKGNVKTYERLIIFDDVTNLKELLGEVLNSLGK